MFYGRVWYDANDLITQLDNNSGDQCARTGELYTGYQLAPQLDFTPPIGFNEALNLLEPKKDGNVLRAALASGFDPNNMKVSRDQVKALIIAAGFEGEKEFIKRVFMANAKRFFRYENGDSMLFDFEVYIRAAHMAGYNWLGLLRPLVGALDIFNLLNTLLIVFLKAVNPGPVRRFLADKLGMYFFVQDYPTSNDPHNPDAWSVHGDTNVGDDILHIQECLQAKKTITTFVSRLSSAIYAKFRPHGIQYALDYYHRPETKSNPLNDLLRPTIKKEFYG